MREIFILRKLVKNRESAISLNGWSQKSIRFRLCVYVPDFVKIIKLVLAKVSDKCALVLFQHKLGHEMADSLHRQEFDDVNLICKSLACSFMPL